MQTINVFELKIANDFTELRRMSDWLHKVCVEMALSETLAMNLDLCANEAVANIICYAYKDQDSHEILISLELDAKSVCLTIQDDGWPFNPFEILSPTPFDTLENAKMGGLGIHLIRSLMDECHYQRCKEKNIITLNSAIISQELSDPTAEAVLNI